MDNQIDKINDIKEILHDLNCIYTPIYNDTSIDKIYELLKNDVVFEPTHIVDYVYLGVYYGLRKNIIEMKKYLKHAIKQNDLYAMYHNCMLFKINKNDKWLKYCLKCVNNNITILSCFLGFHYHEKENYVEMKKYYNMFINDSNNDNFLNMLNDKYSYTNKDYEYIKISINIFNFVMKKTVFDCLGSYYHDIEKNYELMKFYYLQAVENGSVFSLNYLGHYYHNIKDFKTSKYYFLKGIKWGDDYGFINMGEYYHKKQKYDKMKYYYLQIINNIHALKLIVRYYVATEKNYKMAKMYIFTYYKHNNEDHFDNLTFIYRLRRLELLLLEQYLNAKEFVKRESIIGLFNKVGSMELLTKDKIKFMQLVREFDFVDGDVLGDNIVNILNCCL